MYLLTRDEIRRYARAGSAEDCGHEPAKRAKAGKFSEGNTCAAGGGGATSPRGGRSAAAVATKSAKVDKEAAGIAAKGQAAENRAEAERKEIDQARASGKIFAGRSSGWRPSEEDLPEQFRGIFDKEDLRSIGSQEKWDELVQLATSAINNDSKYLPDKEELIVLAKMGESAKGQYEFGGRFLRSVFKANGFDDQMAEKMALVWQSANSIFSARTGLKIHTGAASETFHLWMQEGFPTRNDGDEGRRKIRKIIQTLRRLEKANGSLAYPFDRTKRRKIMELLWNAPDVTGKMKELIANNAWGKTVNFGEAWHREGSVAIDAWMGSLLKPPGELLEGKPFDLRELIDATAGKLGPEMESVDQKIRDFRNEIMNRPAKYHAYKALIHDTAKQLTADTGKLWTPREVQETVWSAAMGIGILRASGKFKSGEIANNFTHELAKHSWDMEGVLNDQTFISEIRRSGVSPADVEALARMSAKLDRDRKKFGGRVYLTPEEQRVAERAAERIPAAETGTVGGRQVHIPSGKGKGTKVVHSWRVAEDEMTPREVEANRKRSAEVRKGGKEAAAASRSKSVEKRRKRWEEQPKVRREWERERDERRARILERHPELARRRSRVRPARLRAGDADDCGHDPDGDFSLENTCASLHGSIRQHEKNPGWYNQSARFGRRLRSRLGELQVAHQEGDSTPDMDREREEIEQTLDTMERTGHSSYDKEYKNMKKMDFIRDAFRRMTILYRSAKGVDGLNGRRIRAAAVVLKEAHDKMRLGEDASHDIGRAAGMIRLIGRESRGSRGEKQASRAHDEILSASRMGRATSPSFPGPVRTGLRPVRRYRGYFREGGVDVPANDGVLTGGQVGLILADQYHNRKARVTPEKVIQKWVASREFKLMNIPLWAIRPYKYVRPTDPTHSSGPLIVDANRRGLRRELGSFGSSNKFMIVDGKHRYYEMIRSGKTHCEAYVGVAIRDELERYIDEFGPIREAFEAAVRGYYDDQTPQAQAALLKAGDDVGLTEQNIYSLMYYYKKGFIFDFAWGKFRKTQGIRRDVA